MPLDTAGTIELPKIPPRMLADKFLADKQIEESILQEHFLRMLHKFIAGVVDQDQEAIEKVAEARFADRMISSL